MATVINAAVCQVKRIGFKSVSIDRPINDAESLVGMLAEIPKRFDLASLIGKLGPYVTMPSRTANVHIVKKHGESTWLVETANDVDMIHRMFVVVTAVNEGMVDVFMAQRMLQHTQGDVATYANRIKNAVPNPPVTEAVIADEDDEEAKMLMDMSKKFMDMAKKRKREVDDLKKQNEELVNENKAMKEALGVMKSMIGRFFPAAEN